MKTMDSAKHSTFRLYKKKKKQKKKKKKKKKKKRKKKGSVKTGHIQSEMRSVCRIS